MMRKALVGIVFAVGAQACGPTDPGDTMPGGSEPEEEVTDPDPEVDLCSTTDGVCLSAADCASTDPDCVVGNEPPPPGCEPNPLPPLPANVVKDVSGLFQTDRVALDGDTLYMTAFTNASPSTTKVYYCPLAGCPASPSSFGARVDHQRSFLEAFGGHVFWSQKADEYAQQPNQVIRANPTGGAQETLITAQDGLGLYGAVSRNVNVWEDYALTFDVVARNGSTSLSAAGVRVATDSLMSPPVPGLSAPSYSDQSVAADDSYLAFYADPISGLTAPYDRKIHIYDLEGVEVSKTAATYSWMQKIAIVGSSLIWKTSDGLYGCTLPACSDAKNVGTPVKVRGHAFAVQGDRIYFGSVADPGCGQSLTGVLASCTAASLLAGTCTPELHSTSIHWVNVDSLDVTATHALMTSRTDSVSTYLGVL